MKIAVSSDWHGHKPAEAARNAIESCDVLLLCGDIFEPFWNNDKLESYLKRVSESGKRIIMTPGNHDFGIYAAAFQDKFDLYNHLRVAGCKRYQKDYLKNELGVECLIGESTDLNRMKIYGTPWTPMFCNWAFMETDGDGLREKYANMPAGADIVISHGPPYDENSKIDSCCPNLYTGQPEHLGSKMLTEAILKFKPKRLFCGHIHSGDHNETTIGETKCVNVSYLGEDYRPKYNIYTFEI